MPRSLIAQGAVMAVAAVVEVEKSHLPQKFRAQDPL